MAHKSFNPNNEQHMSRLWRSVAAGRDELKPFRVAREKLIEQYVGSDYPSNDQTKLPVPVNLIELMMTIYISHLAARSPKALITAGPLNLKHVAASFEFSVNEQIKEMDYSATHQLVVQDAMLRMGMINVGLDFYKTIEYQGRSLDAMEPFALRVDPDDWVHEARVKRFDQVGFCGHRYRLPLDAFMESKEFDKAGKAAAEGNRGHFSHESGEQRVEDMSRTGSAGDKHEFRDYIELWALWIPHENLIVKVDAVTGKKVGVVDWDGPEGGPYIPLTFHDVPNNIMPLSPLGLRQDLHRLANNVWRKVDQAAKDQKTILAYQSGADKDVERILKAGNQQSIRVDHLDQIREILFNGPSAELQLVALQTMRIFDEHAGNLNALGGSGSLGDTATESQLISNAASQRVSHMGRRNKGHLRKVMQSLAWYEWTDPVRVRMLEQQSRRTGRPFTVRWSPETREGDFVQYDIQIDPHSMRDQAPEQLAGVLLQYVTQILVPLSQAYPQQGQVPDIGKLTAIFARYNNIPELNDILVDIGPRQEEEGRHDSQARQAPVTTRNVVRTNRSGGTRQGQDAALALNLLGGANKDQKAALRQTG